MFLLSQVLLAWSGGPSSSSMVWQVLEVRLHTVLLGPGHCPAKLQGGASPGELSDVYTRGAQAQSCIWSAQLCPSLALSHLPYCRKVVTGKWLSQGAQWSVTQGSSEAMGLLSAWE